MEQLSVCPPPRNRGYPLSIRISRLSTWISMYMCDSIHVYLCLAVQNPTTANVDVNELGPRFNFWINFFGWVVNLTFENFVHKEIGSNAFCNDEHVVIYFISYFINNLKQSLIFLSRALIFKCLYFLLLFELREI